MSFDISRFTFDRRRNFSGVVMEQGRVQLDSDWNEWLAELSRRLQAGTLDVFGHAAYPPTTPSAFLISATSSPNAVTIGNGRMYVDGLLAENHGSVSTESWDPALAELSNAPQPPPNPANPNPLNFLDQPYLPNAALPTDAGSYIFYLDVWTRAVDYLQDGHLVDKAVGVDTTGRLQTVWQVKWTANPNGYTCPTPDSTVFPPTTPGRLTTGVVSNTPGGPCCLTDSTGYTGVENQCYRVEIQQAGAGSDPASGTGATFKWSRDNGSVETLVLGISPATNSLNLPASALSVTSIGRDEVLGFKAGDWIELLDDWTELSGEAGILYQVDSVTVSPPSITLTTKADTTTFPVDGTYQTTAARHTRIRRWDQSGNVYDSNNKLWCNVSDTGGAIPIPASDTTLVLENGVTVQFQLPTGATSFNVGDYWVFAARTADGSVQELHAAPPLGIHHHLTKLAVVTFSTPPSVSDCRIEWGNTGCGGCGCGVTVGDGVTSFGQYDSIQAAVDSVIAGGEVQILPGRYYEYVTIANGKDVILRGCGPETRLASPSMRPKKIEDAQAAKAGEKPASGFRAIVTVIGSTNVELRSFAVEAADEVGVLVDSGALKEGGFTNQPKVDAFAILGHRAFSSNVTAADLAITASTMPALLAIEVTGLWLKDSCVAMEDVLSEWPAVWVSGSEIHVERNWIGLQDADDAEQRMPTIVVADVPTGFQAAVPTIPAANGGIQVGGYSQDVFIVDNEIEGGVRNGVSLGSFTVVSDAVKEGATEAVAGLLAREPSSSATTFDLVLPAEGVVNKREGRLVSGGNLTNVEIARNRICNVGLCGIGPVGFFSAATTLEVVTLQNLVIAENTIKGSLQDTLTPPDEDSNSVFGYGAICLADAQNVIIRDNVITDFGDTPGAAVCGVFVLCGEQLEIRGNQIQETRDWASTYTTDAAVAYPQAGILVMLATPPALQPSEGSSFAQGSSVLTPAYQPGLPAVRIVDNVVRVALGRALEVVGFGPFTIAGNQLATGGTMSAPTPSTQLSTITTVLVLNLGSPVELEATNTYANIYDELDESALSLDDDSLQGSSSGAVLFANNRCQLETNASGVTGLASIAILSLDSLQFSANHCWVDGSPVSDRQKYTVAFDALLLARLTQVIGNRFQEGKGAVLVSGVTLGMANITTNNLATYCLLPLGLAAYLTATPNVILEPTLCREQKYTEAEAATKESVAGQIQGADGIAQERAANLAPIRQARLAQSERIQANVITQYGASSAQAKTAAAAVTTAKALFARATVLKAQMSVQVPTAPEQGWTLYGHVYDAQLQPSSAYTVFVVDPQNAYQAAIGFAYTESDGWYQLTYTPATGTTLPASLYLQIANDKGQPVYLASAPLALKTGTSTSLDVTLPAGQPVIGDPPAALRAIALPPTQASNAPKAR